MSAVYVQLSLCISPAVTDGVIDGSLRPSRSISLRAHFLSSHSQDKADRKHTHTKREEKGKTLILCTFMPLVVVKVCVEAKSV